MRRASRRLWSVMAGSVLLLTGCTANSATSEPSGAAPTRSDGSGTSPAPAQQLKADLEAVVSRKVATVAPTRLAPGLVPPTNRWFSGLVFGDKPQPVFPMPLSVALTDESIAVGLPLVTSSAKTIFGGINPQIHLPLKSARMEVTAYDALTVTGTFKATSGATVGSVLLAQGSPFVTYTAAAAQTIPVEPIFQSQSNGLYTATAAGHEYGLVLGGGSTINSTGEVTLPAGSTLTIYAAPDGGSAASLAPAAGHPVVSGAVTNSIVGDTARTTMTYRTKDGGATAISTMAGQHVAGGSPLPGGYAGIYGHMPLYSGSSVTTTAPLLTPSGALDLTHLSAVDKTAVVRQVRSDAGTIDFQADDSYFGGKTLFRATNLMVLAEQLGVTDVASRLRERLTAELTMWFDPKGCTKRSTKCFVYDPVIKSMIGLKASFGSDQMNDHHFHYGYLLYAAAVVGAGDAALVKKIGPVADLVATDIAAAEPSRYFPQYRNFDPYSGHSWASGTSPFADGNNQESSSEAVNAWNALGLWQKLRGNNAAYDQARWMMSVEANSAKSDWLNTDLSAFPQFTAKIVALNWGGKRDYATWFSPDASAMLGIQLLPMGPYADYLAGDAARIKANVAEGASTGYGVAFGEYILQYLALADPQAARAHLGQLPRVIDNGTTKAYVMAWVLSRPGGGAAS